MSKVYGIITDQVIQGLEMGLIPWERPWLENPPANGVTKKPYRGINILWLAAQQFIAGQSFDNPYYMTFNQIKAYGGKVKAGSKALMICFFKDYVIPGENVDHADGVSPSENAVTVPVLRYFNVFNVDQTTLENDPRWEFDTGTRRDVTADKIVDGYQDKPKILAADHAYYSPDRDVIGIPGVKTFKNVGGYYGTLFHELVHSTGHESRLNRHLDTPAGFGSEEYSKEELVAEMGACFLGNMAGIESGVERNTQAYINGWISRLKKDSKIIVSASSAAQKATDYILGLMA